MDEKVIIDVTRLDPEGEELNGEVNAVDPVWEYVRPFGGVRYQLSAQVLGNELLVRGTLEQDFSLVCSRCGKDFDDTVKVGDFTVSYEIDEKNPEIDVTEDIRECVLLELPNYPVCREDCPGIEQKTEMPADERWRVLEKVKVEG